MQVLSKNIIESYVSVVRCDIILLFSDTCSNGFVPFLKSHEKGILAPFVSF